MQEYKELIGMLTTSGIKLEDASVWAKYLGQLKGCSLHSAALQTDDEEAWLAARTHGIGGSDIAAIMGESDWKSPYDIWLTKTGQMPLSGEGAPVQSEAARWGNVLEDSIAYEWARRNNKRIIKIPVSLKFDAYPFMLANIDGFVLSDDGETIEGILEIKTTSTYNNDAWEVGPLPYYYICQATWYTMITGLPAFDIVCLVGGQKLYSYHIPKDLELCDQMQKAAVEFWEVNVKQLVEPKVTAADIPRLQAAELESAPDEEPLVDETEATDNLITAYLELRDKESQYKKLKEGVAAEIWKTIQHKSCMLTRGNVVTVSRVARKTCNYELLARDFPEAYEACISSSVSPRLNIK